MNAGTRLINLAVSLTYFIGVNYNCMDCSSKFGLIIWALETVFV